SFRQFVEDSDNEDPGEGTTANLLTRRLKTKQDQDKEEDEYITWLKGQKEMADKDGVKELVSTEVCVGSVQEQERGAGLDVGAVTE
ncbi:hypothetical protein FKM82_030108, partial [Ascaphus truei]